MTAGRYLLAFDHRASLMRGLLKVRSETSARDREHARTAKALIWEGFERALARADVDATSTGVLVDDTYGRFVLEAARARGIAAAMPLEESGREELEFESPSWRERLSELDPTWAKVLVRYNPLGDGALNERQREKLATISRHCKVTDRRFMLELLVPAASRHVRDADLEHFDRSMRPRLMSRAIQELYEANIEPDLWKLEGLDDRSDCEAVAAAAMAGGRERVGCLVLGRGADRSSVDGWLRVAADVEGYVGFAIGRTIWWEAVSRFFEAGGGVSAREAAADAIRDEYVRSIQVWEAAAHGRSIPGPS